MSGECDAPTLREIELLKELADVKVAHLKEVGLLRAELVERALVTAEAVSSARFSLLKWAIGTLLFIVFGMIGFYIQEHK